MKLNDDHTRATLAINTELDAAGMEELIRALAMLRSQMHPGVPGYPGENTPTLTQDGPALLMDNPLPDGSVLMRLGSVGLGWTGWRLLPRDVEALRVWLEGAKRDGSAEPNGNRH